MICFGRLASPPRCHQHLVEWNDTSARFPRESRLHDLVAAQARRTPDAIAVSVLDGPALSFRELVQRSRRLASRLRRRGVGPESRVGIHLDRSPEMVIALLGTLFAGGAFVPLGPNLPSRRLRFLLGDARPRVIITSRRFSRDVSGQGSSSNGRLLCLDEIDLANIDATPADVTLDDGPPRVDADHPAYVLFTSGSTGRPKAVVIPHRAVCNHRHWMQAELPLDGTDRLLQTAALNFDGSVWEIFAPLIAGAQLILVDETTLGDPAELVEILRRARISVSRVVASLLRPLLDQSALRRCRDLRRLVSVGEALATELTDRARTVLPKCALYNLYGPSEATIHASGALCRRPARHHEPLVTASIGRPIANVKCHVLDEMQRVAGGEAGALYIGGVGLARGYLGRPGLSAERFVPDPYGLPGQRLYATGDRVNRLADGSLTFLGRLDHQVKIRGHRVELGEVERALGDHPDIAEAAVRLTAGERLVAYAVAHRSSTDRLADAWRDEHVEQWRAIYDSTYYDSTHETPDAEADQAGWDSSYTGRSLPAHHIADSVDHTVERLLQLQPGDGDPRRMLEIGCGTGLLLFRLAPSCDRFLGTDLSPTAVAAVRSRLKEPTQRLPQVEVRARPAHEFAGIEEGGFDVVFCNSVVGHFPSADYLLEVIEGMVRAAAPGGSIFVGDVRNLPLEEALATSIETFKASPDLPVTELREQVRRHLRQEDRLAVDPAFFVALPGRLPRITSVRIWPKGGRLLNELTRFRYDVVLELDGGADEDGDVKITGADWRRDVQGNHLDSLTALGEYLEAERPLATVISNVPNARAGWAVSLLARSRTDDGTVGDLGPVMPESVETPESPSREASDAIDLSKLQARLAKTGYRGELSWARCDATGNFDLALWRSELSRPLALDDALLPPVEEPESWSELTNDPLSRQLHRRQVLDLRAHLEERLPDYMVPSSYVLLDAMPRTPGGKLDRQALPEPETDRPELSSDFVAPRSAEEERLAKIWSDVLGVDGIGARDNFFELGGHSLLGTRVAARIRDSFGLELPLRRLFDGPTIAELAVYLERAKRASPDVDPAPQTIEPAPRPADLPLSFAQQRLWFLHQLHPESPAYNSPRGFRLRGPLDTQALKGALGEMCRRHESLRTSFPSVAGQPRQAIVEASPFQVPIVDLGGLGEPEEQQERLAQSLIRREVVRPFDLTRGPLIRVLLVRLSVDHHLFLLNLHHIVTDSWSEEILYREIASFYAAFCVPRYAGHPSSSSIFELPAPPIQYADFALWQRSWLSGERLEQQLSYWRQQLRDLPPQDFPPQDLPARRGKPETEAAADAGAVLEFQLPSRLNEALDALSLRAGTSPFITLLTAFMALLHRTTGQRDLAVGSPVANRGRGELEGLIGFFVNMLVMRARVSWALRFRELLKEVRDVALGAYAHQDLPFEKLVEELQPRRESFENPFFQVAFALHNVARSELELPDLQVDPLTLDSGAVRFALEIHLWPADRRWVDRGLKGSCVYRADQFEPTAVARWITHLENLLADALARPDSRIEELSLLTRAQRQQHLVEWNDSSAARSNASSVSRAFEAQVAQQPDALAVVAQDEHLSYRELNRRSDRLADELRALGLGPEQRVALCVEPSAEMVVGLLAILKAGGAYLPLDPSHPHRRLLLMLRDADASLLLIRRSLIPKVLGEAPASPRRAALAADLEIVGLGGHSGPVDALLSSRAAENLACVLYTSGSTGRPKGIGLTHRSLLGLALATDPLRLRPENRVAQLSNLSFDAATFEIWGPLLRGAPLVVLPEDRPLAPERLATEVQRQRIDTLFLTTALMNVVLRERPDAVRGLKHLLFGGEAAEPHWVDVARAAGPKQLLNFYGPAENTTFASYYQVNEASQGAPVPIGSPVLQTRLYVLKDSQTLPMGSVGELHIAGAGLARGYLGQAARTSRRFLPDPFGRPGTRLYRTGDLVRQRADGLLEFLGRVDHQVKIRGFRVEPSEVEVILKRHVSVRDAVVLAPPATNGHRECRLVAYVVPAETSSVESNRWRSYLGRHLPSYMVPSAFVTLGNLPLTPSGKVDREALPMPDESPLGGEAEYLAPRTSLEATMAKIWSSLLGFERIGVRDNFFELGGHSLLAIQVVSRAREEIGGELPLRWLFDHPTVADLCRVLEERDPESGRPDRWSVTLEEVLPSVPGRMEEGRI